jgi:hypothetical protein
VDDDLDAAPIDYQIYIPGAIDGQYIVRATTEGGMGVSVAACDSTGVLSVAAAIDTSATPVIGSYAVSYASTTGTVSINPLGTTAVEDLPASKGTLRVLRNPTIGAVHFWIAAGAPTSDALEIYDLTGRRVGLVEVGASPHAETTVSWDWRRAGCGAGVYLARLRSTGSVVRFALLR